MLNVEGEPVPDARELALLLHQLHVGELLEGLGDLEIDEPPIALQPSPRPAVELFDLALVHRGVWIRNASADELAEWREALRCAYNREPLLVKE